MDPLVPSASLNVNSLQSKVVTVSNRSNMEHQVRPCRTNTRADKSMASASQSWKSECLQTSIETWQAEL
jgi:hypothetical protein